MDRSKRIGGSDCAAIMGAPNSFKTILQVYLEKVEDFKQEFKNPEPIYWGAKFEELIATRFFEETGLQVRRVNRQLQHPKHKFICGHIDRKIEGQNALLECKSTSAYMAKNWDDDKIPEQYIMQCMHYLLITGYDVAHIAVLIGNQKFLYKEIKRDEEFLKEIEHVEVDFWNNYVLKKVPPMIDGSKTSVELLKVLYPEAKPDAVIDLSNDEKLNNELQDRIVKLEKLKAEYKLIKTDIDLQENIIKEKMKDNEILRLKDYMVSWKNIRSNKFDSKLFKEKFPEKYPAFCNESISRRFGYKKI